MVVSGLRFQRKDLDYGQENSQRNIQEKVTQQSGPVLVLIHGNDFSNDCILVSVGAVVRLGLQTHRMNVHHVHLAISGMERTVLVGGPLAAGKH